MKTEKQIRKLLKETLSSTSERTDNEMARVLVMAKTLHWVLGGED